MKSHFKTMRDYLLDLSYNITHEDENDGVFVVEKAEEGIANLVIGIADPIVIFEQFLFNIKTESIEVFKSLLMKNRDIIHGAFVLDDSGTRVIFRDTLQLENLDLNEVDGTLGSLSLLLSEYSENIIRFSKQ